MVQDEFLLKEYELCFEQQRFYDTRQTATLKFLFGLTASVATAQFAILNFIGSADDTFYIAQAFLSVIVFIASILLAMTIVQNRLYFVFTTRQLNAIRAHFLETACDTFKNNQMWTTTSIPAVKPHSVHMYQLRGAVLMSSLFAASTAFAIGATCTESMYIRGIVATFVFLGVAIAEERWSAYYLRQRGAVSANIAVGHESA